MSQHLIDHRVSLGRVSESGSQKSLPNFLRILGTKSGCFQTTDMAEKLPPGLRDRAQIDHFLGNTSHKKFESYFCIHFKTFMEGGGGCASPV